MNTLGKITSYLKGEGSRPLLQNLTDYGTAAAIGAGGQQLMNWATPGADPNPLISGVLAAPTLALSGRMVRGAINPDSRSRDAWAAARQTTNPYEQAALIGSLGGVLGGGLTNAQNTAFGGADIDPNIAASIFAGIAPIAASLVNRRRSNAPTEANVIM